MAFDLPRGNVFAVDDVDVRLDPSPHPFLAGAEEAVAANWRIEKERKPALFDGEVVLLSELAYRGGQLEGRCHTVRYSEFLYWRGSSVNDDAEHVYANAVLVAADAALVAIRMASHTLNAGLVSFAAGSFEPGDFRAGKADHYANMRREVMEETGLDLAEWRPEKSLHALSLPSGTVIFRRFFSDRSSDDLARSIRRYLAAGGEDEVEEPVVLRAGEKRPGPFAPHMPAVLDWHFAQALSGG